MKHVVITIGREYGSGGRLIAKKLSEELGITFYDKELIAAVRPLYRGTDPLSA